MTFTETELRGAFLIDIEAREDARGFFARTYCGREFKAHGLNPVVAQCNMSFNHKKGTLRGMHFQIAPATETKYIRCTAGAIFYALIDFRPESPTYLQHIQLELTAANRRALFVPGMFAIGYQTLVDNTEVHYMVGEYYTPECERGLRYNDPYFAIKWPLPVTEISAKDASWPLFNPEDWSKPAVKNGAATDVPVASGAGR